ncbi:helix-turn-helix transcriptional regulator [Xenorhabdus innexi]|uniref:Transcriptional regulator n=1 Tax=Xenorhabdus innexi TaxID=290109 RepID=A0A1N6MXV8_9GAMM|nr:WYL domain-containing protein [Xenorhabdus innexi]PHM31207.1 transcriptional regulator [Xenorhabdus innexi]SIP73651.1 putative transcriptional regulator [Xenorhabdus innexi]
MKKTLLLQQMQLFLQRRQKVTLKELMQEFQLSRSSVLRYISALEELGVPLYSERGRNGGYVIAPTYRLAPVRFSADEIHAMLFAISGMHLLQSTPFNLQFRSISEKLKQVLPQDEKIKAEKLRKRLGVRTIRQINPIKHLDMLLNHIFQQENLEVIYCDKKVFIYPIAMWFESGKWFLAVFDYEEQDLRVLRCDTIQSFHPTTRSLSAPENICFTDFDLSNFETLRQKQQQHYFEIKIKKSGIEHYHGKMFSHISLQLTDDSALISGYYHQGELSYLIDYINGFSRHLIDIEPKELRKMYADEIKMRLSQLESEIVSLI